MNTVNEPNPHNLNGIIYDNCKKSAAVILIVLFVLISKHGVIRKLRYISNKTNAHFMHRNTNPDQNHFDFTLDIIK